MYQEAAYQSPYVNSIAESMQQPARARAQALVAAANAQAHATEASGQAWGGAVQQIGQTVGAIPAQMQQQKMQQQEQQIRGLQISGAQRQAENAQIVDHTKQAMAGLMNDPSVLNEDGTFNLKGITDKLSQMPTGAVGPVQPIDLKTIADTIDPINQSILAAKENGLKYQQTKANAMAGLAAGALRLGKIDGNYFSHAASALAAAQKSGIMSDQDATQTLIHLVEQRENIPQILEDFVARSNVPNVKLAQGDTLVSGLDPSNVLAKGAEKPPTEAELAVKAAQGDPTAAAAMDRLKPNTPKDSAAEMDAEYQRIIAKKQQGQSITPTEAATVFAYEKRKTLATDTSASAAANRQAAAIEQQNALQTKAQAFNVASKARDELVKNESAYATAKSATDLLLNTVDDAAKGNKIAASLQSLQTTMGTLKAEGFNRINSAEIGATADAGSIFDRISGWAGKAVAGQPVPADIQKDMREYADLLQKSAYKKYADQFDSVAKYYDFNDQQKSLKMPGPQATTAAVPAAMIEATDPSGQIHHAPAGTPLPPGWKLKK